MFPRAGLRCTMKIGNDHWATTVRGRRFESVKVTVDWKVTPLRCTSRTRRATQESGWLVCRSGMTTGPPRFEVAGSNLRRGVRVYIALHLFRGPDLLDLKDGNWRHTGYFSHFDRARFKPLHSPRIGTARGSFDHLSVAEQPIFLRPVLLCCVVVGLLSDVQGALRCDRKSRYHDAARTPRDLVSVATSSSTSSLSSMCSS